MADSSVPVTAGSGTSIDTRTESTNSNHRQVIVIGDPSANAGVAPVDATNGLAVQIIPALPAGSNAIGKLAANSGVNIGTVTVDATQLAALLSSYVAIATTNATQVALPTDHPTLAVAQDTARILNGVSGTSLTPKFAAIVASSSGATTIVAAVTSKKIRVLAWDLAPNAAVNAKWQSHVTPTDLTGLYYMGGQGNGQSRPFNPVGWFQTVAGEALDINLSGAVAVGGCLIYVEV